MMFDFVGDSTMTRLFCHSLLLLNYKHITISRALRTAPLISSWSSTELSSARDQEKCSASCSMDWLPASWSQEKNLLGLRHLRRRQLIK